MPGRRRSSAAAAEQQMRKVGRAHQMNCVRRRDIKYIYVPACSLSLPCHPEPHGRRDGFNTCGCRSIRRSRSPHVKPSAHEPKLGSTFNSCARRTTNQPPHCAQHPLNTWELINGVKTISSRACPNFSPFYSRLHGSLPFYIGQF